MKWKRSNPAPSPEQLAAWADGELDRPDAEAVESWLLAHPEAAAGVEADQRLGRLFRDNPPPEPSERAWRATLAGIDAGLTQPVSSLRNPGPWRWRLRLIVGLVATAAAVGGILVARMVSSGPKRGPEIASVEEKSQPIAQPGAQAEDDEPFPVVNLSEVNIISIDADDADRVVMGQELMGTFDLAAPEDIEIVKMEPRPDDGWAPYLRRGPEVPMIVAANLGNPER
jgi:hypothetical protein